MRDRTIQVLSHFVQQNASRFGRVLSTVLFAVTPDSFAKKPDSQSIFILVRILVVICIRIARSAIDNSLFYFCQE